MDSSNFQRMVLTLEIALSDRQGKNVRSDGGYKLIGYTHYKVFEILQKFKSSKEWSKTPKFVDVGCGIGSQLYVAREVGFDVFGIECDERLANIAKAWCNSMIHTCCHFRPCDSYIVERGVEGERIEVCDAMEYKNYNQFDLIYFYTPIADSLKMLKLRNIIGEQMREDAFVLDIQKDKTPLSKEDFLKKWRDEFLQWGIQN